MTLPTSPLPGDTELSRLREKIDQLEAAIAEMRRGSVAPRSLDELTDDLGTLRAGRFEAVTGTVGVDASGVVIDREGLTYLSQLWSIVGLENEVLNFGLRASDGAALFSGGDAVIDENGLVLSGWGNPVVQRQTIGTTTVEVISGLFAVGGSSFARWIWQWAKLSTTEKVVNGGFETGDLTGWTASPGAGGVAEASASFVRFGKYSARVDGTGAAPSTLRSDRFSVSAGEVYRAMWWARLNGSSATGRSVVVKWYNAASGGALLRTDTTLLNANSASYYVAYLLLLLAPVGAQSAEIVLTADGGSNGNYMHVDGVSFVMVNAGVHQLYADADASLTYYANGVFDGAAIDRMTRLGDFPDRAVCWHSDAKVVSGNALALTPDLRQALGHTVKQSASASTDVFEQTFFIAAGTYTLSILGVTVANGGKVDWTLDGSSIATGQDWYSAATTHNVVKTVSSVVIASGGKHTLRGTVNGKNASSGGYDVILTRIDVGPYALPSPGAAAAAAGHTVKEDGGALTQRGGLNFGSGLKAADDSGNDETDVDLDIAGLTADSAPDVAADYVATYDASASANKKALLNVLLNGLLPNRATMWHDESLVVTGNPLLLSVNTSQLYCLNVNQNVAADGDVFEQTFFIAAGTYTLSILGVTVANGGKVDWTLDGSSIATGQDWYSAATTHNVVKTVSSVVIASGGKHTLRGTVNGKNAASTGYRVLLTKMWLK